MTNEDKPLGKKIPIIKDIAAMARVSTGTVDRVIHNRGKVSEKVRERILKIIRELNYEPNVMARALVSSGNHRIAVLVPDPANDEYWEAPNAGIDTAEEEMRQYGVVIEKYLFDQHDAETFKRQASRISEMKYNGILLAPLFYRESLAFLSKWNKDGTPFNLFNTHIPDYEPVTYVGQDSYQSGVLAGKLLHYGNKGSGTFIIAHIDKEVANSSHLIKKEQGFIDYFDGGGHDEVKLVRIEINEWEDEAVCFKQMDALLKENSDVRGFFVTNSRSYVVGKYLKSRGITGLHLVGYDLLSKNISLLNEGIIDFLINQNPHGQGYWGVRLMADFLVFKKSVEQIKYLPLDVVTKENLQYYE